MDLNSAIAAHRAGRLSEAETAYRAHLLAHPTDARTWQRLGMLLHQAGRTTEALGAGWDIPGRDIRDMALIGSPRRARDNEQPDNEQPAVACAALARRSIRESPGS